MAYCVLVVNGHPDSSIERYCAAIARAYAKGARAAGHEVREISIGDLRFPMLRSGEAFIDDVPPPAIKAAQDDFAWAEHVFIVFPLWLGGLPALTKGFFEQVFRPNFALRWRPNDLPDGLMQGKSVRLVVTMGMPALVFQWLFGAAGVRAFELGVLKLSGFRRNGTTFIGGLAQMTQKTAKHWLNRIQMMGMRDI